MPFLQIDQVGVTTRAGGATMAVVALVAVVVFGAGCRAAGTARPRSQEGTLLCPTGGTVVVRNNAGAVDVYASGQDLPRRLLGTAQNGRSEFGFEAATMTITAGSARIPAGRLSGNITLTVACNRGSGS